MSTLQERDFSADRRRELADDGKALPDGSFPIANAADLANAIKALGRAKDPAKARAHIVARARALKLESKVPSGWKISEARERAVETHRVVVAHDVRYASEMTEAGFTPPDSGRSIGPDGKFASALHPRDRAGKFRAIAGLAHALAAHRHHVDTHGPTDARLAPHHAAERQRLAARMHQARTRVDRVAPEGVTQAYEQSDQIQRQMASGPTAAAAAQTGRSLDALHADRQTAGQKAAWDAAKGAARATGHDPTHVMPERSAADVRRAEARKRDREAAAAKGSDRPAGRQPGDISSIPKGPEHVAGVAEVGDRVSYEDMANPHKSGHVVGTVSGGKWGPDQFRVKWDDGTETVSDLRQHGWKHEPSGAGPSVPQGDVHGGGEPAGKGWGIWSNWDPRTGTPAPDEGMSASERAALVQVMHDPSPANVQRALDQGVPWPAMANVTGKDVTDLQKSVGTDRSATHSLTGGKETHRTRDDILALEREGRVNGGPQNYSIATRDGGIGHRITHREVDPVTGQASGFGVSQRTGQMVAWRQSGKVRRSASGGAVAPVHVAHAEDTGDHAGTLRFDWLNAQTHDVHESIAGPFSGRSSKQGNVTGAGRAEVPTGLSDSTRQALEAIGRAADSGSEKNLAQAIQDARSVGIPWSAIHPITGKSLSTMMRLGKGGGK